MSTSPAEQTVLDNALMILQNDANPLTAYEHWLVDELARALYVDLSGLRESTTADSFAIACDSYRKALDFLVVARMFDRLHPESAAGAHPANTPSQPDPTPHAP